MKNKKLIRKLLKACISNKPYTFLPYLYLCKRVHTGFPTKWRYYQCLCGLLKKRFHVEEDKPVGKITVVVKPSPLKYKSSEAKAYCFYDEVHVNKRMYILIEEQPKKIILDLFPF
ncbi:MAG: hypothetical protein ACOX19_03015 [Fermentimonas sp.]